MKLYAFYPNGHGQFSFFVMADSEENARIKVTEHIKKNHTKDDVINYEAQGWGTDYYKCVVADENTILENDNS